MRASCASTGTRTGSSMACTSVRLGEDPKLCLLVVIAVREDGSKELLAVEDGLSREHRFLGGGDARPEGPRDQRAEARREGRPQVEWRLQSVGLATLGISKVTRGDLPWGVRLKHL